VASSPWSTRSWTATPAPASPDVTLRICPQARHEIFNETNRDEVTNDLLTSLNHELPAGTGQQTLP